MTASTMWALADQISSQCGRQLPLHAENGDAEAITHISSRFILPPHLRPCPPPALASNAAPAVLVIDLARPNGDDLLLAQLHSACSQWGLFHVVNHGVPDAVLCRLQSQIEAFLALPVAERSPHLLGNLGEGYGTGFIRRGTGIMEWRDCLRLRTFPPSHRNYDAWPNNPHFREALEDFSDATHNLQMQMLHYILQSLGLAATKFEEIVGEMQQTILMNHYPPCPQPSMVAGVDSHTDIGAITCQWQYDDVIGLHALHDGKWLPVHPPPGALTILVGDQVQIASNGIYKSAMHRGVVSSTKHRVSMVSFYQLKAEQVVSPAQELVDDQHELLYPPTRFSDHEFAKKGSHSSSSNGHMQ
ncbi:hypothetical protein L7F22_041527 [Adiantum nelumboides]|nr:hypothetical protein [Adiantum nelumboides]